MGLFDAPALSPKAAAAKFAPFPVKNVASRAQGGNSQSNGTDLTQTSRLRFVIRGSVDEVRLVFANFYLPTGGNEPINPYTVNVRCSVENPATAAGSQPGTSLIPVFFGGKRTGTIEPGGILISDPVFVNITDGQPLWVRSSPSVASGDKWVNSYTSVNSADAKFDGSGMLEGVLSGTDATDSGAISGSNSFAFGPNAILASSPARKPSVLVCGDSIAARTGIVSQGQVTYPTRACINAGLPVVNIAEDGERVLTVAQQISYWKRMRLAFACTDALANYGTNDIYSSACTLAQLKADALIFWTALYRLGLKVHALTILPRPGASTDGYMTVASQSIADAPKEAIRVAYNDWLRDLSANGARAQSAGALVSVLDPCSVIEVNAAGAPTMNGGFIKSVAAPIRTGTATSVAGNVITDTAATRTVNAEIGLTLAITNATTGAAQAQTVLTNTATAWTLLSALSPVPTGTVGYQLGQSYIYDGTHPTEKAHQDIGDALNLSQVITA